MKSSDKKKKVSHPKVEPMVRPKKVKVPDGIPVELPAISVPNWPQPVEVPLEAPQWTTTGT